MLFFVSQCFNFFRNFFLGELAEFRGWFWNFIIFEISKVFEILEDWQSRRLEDAVRLVEEPAGGRVCRRAGIRAGIRWFVARRLEVGELEAQRLDGRERLEVGVELGVVGLRRAGAVAVGGGRGADRAELRAVVEHPLRRVHRRRPRRRRRRTALHELLEAAAESRRRRRKLEVIFRKKILLEIIFLWGEIENIILGGNIKK